MQQLTGMDASFLYAETPRAHMAGGGISIYDPSTAPGGAGDVQGDPRPHRQAAPRGAGLPPAAGAGARSTSTTRTGSRTPTSTSSSTSATSPCRQPGDWRQLCIQVARLVSRPLDLDRPLWELYVIEGLDNVEGVPPGSFALVTKVHHAAIDGMSGMEMTSAIHDDEPTADPPTVARRRGARRRCRAPASCCGGPGSTTPPARCTPAGWWPGPCPSSAGCSARSAGARSPRRRRRSRAPAGAARSPPTACSTPSGFELDDLRAIKADGAGRDDQRRRADDRRRRPARRTCWPRASCRPTR